MLGVVLRYLAGDSVVVVEIRKAAQGRVVLLNKEVLLDKKDLGESD